MDSIPFALPDLTETEIQSVVSTLRSGWITTGPTTAAFEQEFADHTEASYAVAVNSATAGLHLAVEALGMGPGDEVLVPTWTFTATAEIVRYVGASPVLVDCDPRTLNLDFEDAARRITPRTRGIIPVHFAGLPVPRRQLAEFAEAHKLWVIEDAAHSFPAVNEQLPVGADSLSRASVFSFYATKTMTTGEGGMLVTNHAEVARRARLMRLHGIDRDVFNRYTSTKPGWQYDVVEPGFKYNMTDVAAAIGRVQLARAREMRDRRASIAKYYQSEFSDLPVQLPQDAPPGSQHAWHLYVLRLISPEHERDRFIEDMASHGVGCSVHFIPLHLHTVWRTSCGVGPADYPTASSAATDVVSLPIYSAMSDDQVSRVAATVRRLLQ